MLYRGQFRDINNTLYTVDFITNNLTTKTIELKLSGKKPLEIETEDGDTLFEPVKSRSATVTIVTDEIISEIAQKSPYYFVMRDSSMASDSVAVNFEQLFKSYSPDTRLKVY